MDQETRQIIEPRPQTPLPESRLTEKSCRLPDDLMSEQVQRLAVFSAVAGGLWTVALVMDTIVRPLTVSAMVPRAAMVIEVSAIATCVALFLYVRYAHHTASTKMDAGLWFMVINAIDIALLNTWVMAQTPDTMGRFLSWNTIVILVSAMILPTTTPRKMLAASMAAASMDPLGVWIAHLRGLPVPSVLDTFVVFVPNYTCAVVATVPSHLYSA